MRPRQKAPRKARAKRTRLLKVRSRRKRMTLRSHPLHSRAQAIESAAAQHISMKKFTSLEAMQRTKTDSGYLPM